MAGPQYLATERTRRREATSAATTGPIGQKTSEGDVLTTPENAAAARAIENPPVAAATPADQLIIDSQNAGVLGPGTENAIAARQNAAQSGLTALELQLMGAPAASAQSNLEAARQAGVGTASQARYTPMTTQPLGVQRPAAASDLSRYSTSSGGAAGTQGGIATGAGSGQISAVDQALMGYDPNFNVPGTGQMGDLAERTTMGAMPGATDRGVQMSALDRVLGFDPSVGTSVAQEQLRDATARNLGQSLALARSARGGPAAVAQALRMAQAEGAATMSQAARDAATLRAREEDTRKARELEALGLGGELSTALRTSDVAERAQNVGALEAELNAGVTQRGQEADLIRTERESGVTERGQTLDAQAAQKRAELDALVARGGLAQTERQAGAQERGQTLDAILGAEQQKTAREQIAATALTDSEKIDAEILMTRATLGYQLTPQERAWLMTHEKELGEQPWWKEALGLTLAVVNTAGAAAVAGKKAGLF